MSTLNIALDYIARDWAVVPIAHKEKAPKIRAWQKLDITPDNAAKFFNGVAQNIGVQLGTKSKGLADIDHDCAEAVTLAPHFLPPTDAVFGRKSKPASHYLYVIGDASEKATEPLKDENKATIIELRMGGGKAGAQTVFPGSTHPSGEKIEWAKGKDGAPAKSDYRTLKQAIAKIAIGAILIRQWPKQGGTHEIALTLGGFLARAGWTPEEIGEFVGILTDVAGGDKDNERTAREAAEDHAKGKEARGFPSLAEDWGEKAAKAIAKIAGYKADKTASYSTRAEDIPVIVSWAMNAEGAVYVNIEGSGGKEMKIPDGADIYVHKRFAIECFKQLRIVFPPVSPLTWANALKNAPKMGDREEDEDTTQFGEFKEKLTQYLTNRYHGKHRTDLLRGAVFEDEEEGRYYFRMEYLAFEMKRMGFDATRPQMAKWIKEELSGGRPKNPYTVKDGIQVRVYWVPSGAFTKTPELDLPQEKVDFL